MAEQQTYEFVEVKAEDILAERQRSWEGFITFTIWSTAISAVTLVLLAIFLL